MKIWIVSLIIWCSALLTSVYAQRGSTRYQQTISEDVPTSVGGGHSFNSARTSSQAEESRTIETRQSRADDLDVTIFHDVNTRGHRFNSRRNPNQAVNSRTIETRQSREGDLDEPQPSITLSSRGNPGRRVKEHFSREEVKPRSRDTEVRRDINPREARLFRSRTELELRPKETLDTTATVSETELKTEGDKSNNKLNTNSRDILGSSSRENSRSRGSLSRAKPDPRKTETNHKSRAVTKTGDLTSREIVSRPQIKPRSRNSFSRTRSRDSSENNQDNYESDSDQKRTSRLREPSRGRSMDAVLSSQRLKEVHASRKENGEFPNMEKSSSKIAGSRSRVPTSRSRNFESLTAAGEPVKDENILPRDKTRLHSRDRSDIPGRSKSRSEQRDSLQEGEKNSVNKNGEERDSRRSSTRSRTESAHGNTERANSYQDETSGTLYLRGRHFNRVKSRSRYEGRVVEATETPLRSSFRSRQKVENTTLASEEENRSTKDNERSEIVREDNTKSSYVNKDGENVVIKEGVQVTTQGKQNSKIVHASREELRNRNEGRVELAEETPLRSSFTSRQKMENPALSSEEENKNAQEKERSQQEIGDNSKILDVRKGEENGLMKEASQEKPNNIVKEDQNIQEVIHEKEEIKEIKVAVIPTLPPVRGITESQLAKAKPNRGRSSPFREPNRRNGESVMKSKNRNEDGVRDEDNYPEVYKQLKKSGNGPKEILALLMARKAEREAKDKAKQTTMMNTEPTSGETLPQSSDVEKSSSRSSRLHEEVKSSADLNPRSSLRQSTRSIDNRNQNEATILPPDNLVVKNPRFRGRGYFRTQETEIQSEDDQQSRHPDEFQDDSNIQETENIEDFQNVETQNKKNILTIERETDKKQPEIKDQHELRYKPRVRFDYKNYKINFEKHLKADRSKNDEDDREVRKKFVPSSRRGTINKAVEEVTYAPIKTRHQLYEAKNRKTKLTNSLGERKVLPTGPEIDNIPDNQFLEENQSVLNEDVSAKAKDSSSKETKTRFTAGARPPYPPSRRTPTHSRKAVTTERSNSRYKARKYSQSRNRNSPITSELSSINGAEVISLTQSPQEPLVSLSQTKELGAVPDSDIAETEATTSRLSTTETLSYALEDIQNPETDTGTTTLATTLPGRITTISQPTITEKPLITIKPSTTTKKLSPPKTTTKKPPTTTRRLKTTTKKIVTTTTLPKTKIQISTTTTTTEQPSTTTTTTTTQKPTTTTTTTTQKTTTTKKPTTTTRQPTTTTMKSPIPKPKLTATTRKPVTKFTTTTRKPTTQKRSTTTKALTITTTTTTTPTTQEPTTTTTTTQKPTTTKKPTATTRKTTITTRKPTTPKSTTPKPSTTTRKPTTQKPTTQKPTITNKAATTTTTNPTTTENLSNIIERSPTESNYSQKTSTENSLKTGDYFIYGLLPNKTLVRKIIRPTPSTTELPFVIYGLYPNGTIVRKFPNGTVLPDEPPSPSQNELVAIVDPNNKEEISNILARDRPLAYLYPTTESTTSYLIPNTISTPTTTTEITTTTTTTSTSTSTTTTTLPPITTTTTKPTTKKTKLTTTKKPKTTTAKPATTSEPTTTTPMPTTTTTLKITTKSKTTTTAPKPIIATTPMPTTPKQSKTAIVKPVIHKTPKRTTTLKPLTTESTTTTNPTTPTPQSTTRKPTTTTKRPTKTILKPKVTTKKPTTSTTPKPTTTTTPKPTTTTTSKPTTTTTKPITTTRKFTITSLKPKTTRKLPTATKKMVTTKRPSFGKSSSTTHKATTSTTLKPPTTVLESSIITDSVATGTINIENRNLGTQTTTMINKLADPQLAQDFALLNSLLALNEKGNGNSLQSAEFANPSNEEESLANRIIQLAVDRAQTQTVQAQSTTEPGDTQKLVQSTMEVGDLQQLAPTQQGERESKSISTSELGGLEATTKAGGKISLWVVPKDEPTQTTQADLQTKQIPKLSSADEAVLNALLSSPSSTAANIPLTDQLLLAELLSQTASPGVSQNLISNTKKPRTRRPRPNTTSQPFPALVALFGGAGERPQGGLFGGGFLQRGSGLDSESGGQPNQGGLVLAAINITRAVSQFMALVLQGAAQSFQNFLHARTQALATYLARGGGVAGVELGGVGVADEAVGGGGAGAAG